MIEPMTRATMIFLTSQEEAALNALGEVGVLHLDAPQKAKLGDLGQGRAKLERLDAWLKDRPAQADGDPALGRERFEELEELNERAQRLTRQIAQHKAQAQRFAPLGQFKAQDVEALENADWHLTLYELRPKDRERFAPRDFWFPLFYRNHRLVAALISRQPNPYPELRRAPLPEHNPDELRQLAYEKQQELGQVQAELDYLQSDLGPLLAYRRELANGLHFEEALATLGRSGPVAYASGHVPTEALHRLRQLALERGMVLFCQPADPELAPTKLRQGFLGRWFNPVLRFIGVLPGYRELDANAPFMLFFALFFALLVGDAGYGALLILATLLVQWRSRKLPREIFPLFYLLGISTLIWGSLSGIWFGAEAALSWPFLGALVVPQLNAWSKASQDVVIQMTFLIGLGQLVLAHLWQFWRTRRWSSRFTELGWALLVAGLYPVALHFVLRHPLAPWALPTLRAALVLVLLFSEQAPERSWGIGLLKGAANFPLNLLDGVNNFSDLVSYIRLFAVGLATKEMAATFNRMALDIGFDSLSAGLGALLVLFLGHLINIALAGIAVMVHGIRLNFLEFSKHLNLQWTGRAYRPFRLLHEPQGNYGLDD